MSEATGNVLIVITSLSFLTSAATLTFVVLGAKKAQAEIDAVKTQLADTRKKFKTFLTSLDI